MDQGKIRADVNLSLAPKGTGGLGTRTETKNVNSFRSVERAVRYEMQRHAAILDGGRLDPAGDPALARGHRGHHQRSREVRRRGLPLLPRARPGAGGAEPRSGSRSCAARCRRTRPQKRARLQAEWGFSDLEMRDTVGAGAFGLVEETIAAGAAPQAARKWWLSELARRANDTGTDIADLGVTPADVVAVQALVDAGTHQRQAGPPGLRGPVRR